MTEERIQLFLMSYQKYFNVSKIPIITETLNSVDDTNFSSIASFKYRDPMLMLIVSIFFGGLGIDRFLVGDVELGILKLLTCGGFGILTILDWFKISERTREKNFETFIASIRLYNIQNKTASNTNNKPNIQSSDIVEEIKKYKYLLDNGIITQEEFEQKKKELL